MNIPKAIGFLFYTATLLIIIAISSYGSLFLLAPPYAVSAYLMIFESKSKFSRKSFVAVSYIFVILSSEIIHISLGISLYSMALNVIIVSLFVSYSRYSHPPAIALAIFSYIVHNALSFAITSLIVLSVILVITYFSEIVMGRLRKTT